MLNYIWPIIIIISFIYSVYSGNVGDLNNSIFTSLQDVISLSMTLIGTMSLWCGFMEIVKNTSIMDKLNKLLKPILGWLFPDAKENEEAMNNISINVISNILGLGNAATPAGLKAIECLQDSNKDKKRLSDSMIMLIVLNTASIQLIPTTVIAIRTSLKSSNPAGIIMSIWVSTIIGTAVGIIASKILIAKTKRKKVNLGERG